MVYFAYYFYFLIDVEVRAGMMRITVLATDSLTDYQASIFEETIAAIVGVRAGKVSSQQSVVDQNQGLADFTLQSIDKNDVGFVLADLCLAGKLVAKRTVAAEAAVLAMKKSIATNCLEKQPVNKGKVARGYLVVW